MDVNRQKDVREELAEIENDVHSRDDREALPGGSGECNKKGEGEHKEEREAEVEGPPDYSLQKEEIQPLLSQKLRKGDEWYLVDQKWLKQWQKYVGFDASEQFSVGKDTANPGPVDNSNLFKSVSGDVLKEHLMEESDYALLPKPAWDKLSKWYGLRDGSRLLIRRVVEYGTYAKHLKVEVYRLELKLCVFPHLGEGKMRFFSRADLIKELQEEMLKLFELPKDLECRLWQRYMTNSYELLNKPEQTLSDASVYGGQLIMLEKKSPDGKWPRDQSPYSGGSSVGGSTGYGGYCSGHSSYYVKREPTTPALPGASGECNKKGEGEHKEEREAEVEEKGEADEADEEKGEAVDTEDKDTLDKDQNLLENSQQIREMERKLHNLQQQLQNKDHKLQQQSQQLQQMAEQIQEQEQRIKHIQLQMQEKQQVLRQRNKLLQVKEVQIKDLSQDLQHAQQQTREKQELLQQKDLQVQDLSRDLQRAQQQTQEKQELLQQKDLHVQVQDLSRDLQRAQQQTQEKQELLQQKDLQVQDLSRDLQRAQHQVRQLHSDLSQQSTEPWVISREELTLKDELLGTGAYGEVRVAMFRGTKFAAKILHSVIISDYNLRTFEREMTIASQVRHPNLLLFIGATTQGHPPIILTELMATSLRDELSRHPLSKQHIKSIAIDVACGLSYLHQRKPHPIIHRDVSSPNVLLKPSVDNSWETKVSDYGSANFIQQISTKSAMPGNPAYAAPEAQFPSNHTPNMDVYSFGVLLFEMSLQQQPDMSVVGRAKQAKMVQWGSLAEIVEECMAHSSTDRPSIAVVIDKLRQLYLYS